MTYDLSMAWTAALIAAIIWELAWKAYALWRAAQLEQRVWFVLMLVISSGGILPIFYLLTHRESGHSLTTHKGAI